MCKEQLRARCCSGHNSRLCMTARSIGLLLEQLLLTHRASEAHKAIVWHMVCCPVLLCTVQHAVARRAPNPQPTPPAPNALSHTPDPPPSPALLKCVRCFS